MASPQVAASPAVPSRREHLEAGRRKLEEFRKQKAAERAKKASSSKQSQSSRIENSQIEEQSAASVVADTPESNGISFEMNFSKDLTSSVFQTSSTTTSALSFPLGPSSEGRRIETFNDENVQLKSSAEDLIHKGKTALDFASGSIYSSRQERQPYKDSGVSNGQNMVTSNGTSYMNVRRQSSLGNISELSKKHDTKSGMNESTKQYIESSDSYSNKAEQLVEDVKDEFHLSQEKNTKDIHSNERKEMIEEFKEVSSAETQFYSSLISKFAEENAWHRERSQLTTQRNLFYLADKPGNKSQMNINRGSIYGNNSLLEPKFRDEKYNVESVAFGNGKLGDEDANASGEGSKFLFSRRSSSGMSENQDSVGAQFHSDAKNGSSTTQFPIINSHRSRPSFLDSITSSAPFKQTQMAGLETSMSRGESTPSEISKTAELPSKNPWQFVNYPQEGFKNPVVHDSIHSHLEFSSSQKNDDFAALEQHIEDLTQEKFALQRVLDASRTLAESLAQENSSLTEAFNQQGSVVSQLKADLERQQEEIKAQLLILNQLKMESDNAQLECNAADERAKMLASEVISLEEKALRLRSNELKLERHMETLNDEIASNRKHISSLEKERLDLRSTIDSLQEEKKLLQSKLRKAASNGSLDGHATPKPSKEKKDASTSTEDIGIELFNFPAGNGLFLSRNDDVTNIIPTSQVVVSTANVPYVLDAHSAGSASSISFSSPPFTNSTSNLNLDLPLAIPSDQQRMVDNINSLLEELALEKESLTSALKAESAKTTKLRASNQELSHKLESQTQRLELLISQNMAHDNSALGPRDIDGMHEEIEYVDEGDEVVERVLGWIMKLFPGGSSKRRTSKLL